MVYWEIPIKYENIIIKYEKNSQLFRDNTNKIYFKVNEINDEFKNKFSISNNKFLNFFKKKNEKKNIEDYIYFDEATKVEINKYSITKNDEFLEKIKEFVTEEIVFSSVLYKGMQINELVSDINSLKDILLEMKNELEIIKQGSFTKLNLEKVKNDFDSQCEDIIKYFVITENKPANFSEILKIKEDFESIILSIKKGFNVLFNYYYNNIGNITNNFEIKLNKIFSLDLNFPLSSEAKIYDFNYQNINLNSSLISIPIITKKNGKLICNYSKISFQLGPICPELYSKPIILYIISLIDEDINAEIFEFSDKKEDIDEYENNEEKEEEEDEEEEEKEIKVEKDEDVGKNERKDESEEEREKDKEKNEKKSENEEEKEEMINSKDLEVKESEDMKIENINSIDLVVKEVEEKKIEVINSIKLEDNGSEDKIVKIIKPINIEVKESEDKKVEIINSINIEDKGKENKD